MPGSSRSIRVIKILEAVAGADRPMQSADIMEACDLPKATVHRICSLLLERNYLRHAIGRRGLVPGPELHQLAATVFASKSNYALRHAILEKVARGTGETCNLARPDGTAMVYWDRVETEWPLKVQMPIGTRVPLHCSASGKMYLSSLPPARRKQFIKTLELRPNTDNSITDLDALERELDRVAKAQMATDDQEFSDSMIAVAVAVKDLSGRLYATLSIHAPVFRMDLEGALKHIDLLRAAADELRSDIALSQGSDQSRIASDKVAGAT